MTDSQFYKLLENKKDKIMDLVNDDNWESAEFKFLKLVAIRSHLTNKENIDIEILKQMAVI